MTKKRFGHYQEINLAALRNDDLIKECEGYKVYQVSEVDPNLPKRSIEISQMANGLPGCKYVHPLYNIYIVFFIVKINF